MFKKIWSAFGGCAGCAGLSVAIGALVAAVTFDQAKANAGTWWGAIVNSVMAHFTAGTCWALAFSLMSVLFFLQARRAKKIFRREAACDGRETTCNDRELRVDEREKACTTREGLQSRSNRLDAINKVLHNFVARIQGLRTQGAAGHTTDWVVEIDRIHADCDSEIKCILKDNV